MDKLKAELESFLTQDPTEDEIEAWFDSRIAANKLLVAQLQAVEDFCEKRRVARLDDTLKSKDIRKRFYQDRAAQVDPPIALGVLWECESYRRAANIHRPAVDLERSWLTLLPKLEKERVEIEARRAEERRREEEKRKKEEEKRRREEENRKREEEERKREGEERRFQLEKTAYCSTRIIYDLTGSSPNVPHIYRGY